MSSRGGIDSVFPPTKFDAPRAGAHTVARRDLAARLGWAVDSFPVTLVVAPAGSGKTTLVAQWRATVDRPVGWVRVRDDDDDSETLTAALVCAACRATGSDPDATRVAATLREGAVTERQLTAALVRDLSEAGDLVLVVDDLQEVQSASATSLLSRVLDALPAGPRFVLCSRVEPSIAVARRSVGGHLATLGQDDLRFTSRHVRALVDENLVDVEALLRSTDGWATAVALLAPRQSSGPPMLTASGEDLHAYLRAEVLDVERDAVRDLLLACSVLDELTPEAVRAVSDDPAAVEILDELHHRSHFITRLAGTSAPTFRFHDLFRDFLRDRLVVEQPDRVAALHRAAAAVTPPGVAVAHLVTGGVPEQAARLLDDLARPLITNGLDLLPAAWTSGLSDELIAQHPCLATLVGMRHMRSGTMEAAASYFDAAAEALDPDDEVMALVHLSRCEVRLALHDVEGAIASREAVDETKLPPRQLAALRVGRVWTSFYVADWAAVTEQLRLALTATPPDGWDFVVLGVGPDLLWSDLGPDWLVERLERMRLRLSPATGALAALFGTLAWDRMLRGDEAGAVAHLDAAEADSDAHGGVAWIDPLIVAGRLTVDQMRGDVDAVVARATDATERMATEPVQRQQAGGYAVTVARALADAGRHHEIDDICRPLLAWAEGTSPWSEADATMVDLARDDRRRVDVERAGVERADVDWAARADRAGAIIGVHDAYRLGFGHGFPRLEAATAALALGDEHRARNLARPLLELFGPSRLGPLRTERARHRDVLSLFAADPTFGPALRDFGLVGAPAEPDITPIEVPGTGEVLTPREVEVLRLVADGLSNRDVGERLYISERTVKSHMTAVLRKTSARNRTEAAALARRLGLA